LGVVPLALGIGEGSEIQQPMGIAVIGGLISSTFLTLYIVPVLYSFMDKETRSMNRHLIAPDGRVIRELAVSEPARYKALYGESMTDNYLQQTDLTDDHEGLYPNNYLYNVPTEEQDEQSEEENTDDKETEDKENCIDNCLDINPRDHQLD